MALKLYRRHRTECEGAHPEDARSGEFEESRRGWKKCGCLIHVSGTLGGKFNRRQTGKADWDEAKALVALWEKAASDRKSARLEKVRLPDPRIRHARRQVQSKADWQGRLGRSQGACCLVGKGRFRSEVGAAGKSAVA